MDNEVTVVIWMKLDVDIGILWCRLVFTVTQVTKKCTSVERTVTSTLKTVLMSDDFPECLCRTKIEVDRHSPERSMCAHSAPSLQQEFGIYGECVSYEVQDM
jgi:hypothetical protein